MLWDINGNHVRAGIGTFIAGAGINGVLMLLPTTRPGMANVTFAGIAAVFGSRLAEEFGLVKFVVQPDAQL